MCNRNYNKVNQNEKDKVIKMYKRGASVTEISQEINRSTSAIYEVIKEYRIETEGGKPYEKLKVEYTVLEKKFSRVMKEKLRLEKEVDKLKETILELKKPKREKFKFEI